MTALQLLLAICFWFSQPSSATPKCDETIMNNIKNHWATVGYPRNVFQVKGNWTVAKTTDATRFNNVNCMTYTVVRPGQAIVSIDGVVNSIIIDESEQGMIHLNDTEVHFKIEANLARGTYCGYHCSMNGTAVTPENNHDGGLVVTDYATETDKDKAVEVMGKIGLALVKTFSCPKSVVP